MKPSCDHPCMFAAQILHVTILFMRRVSFTIACGLMIIYVSIFAWSTNSAHVSDTASKMTLNWLDNYPTAVCNDGSKGGYYFSPASDPSGRNIFVIHLPGGGQCYSLESCADRTKKLGCNHMSSSCFTPHAYSTGLLDSSPEKSPLWNANKAMLGYCSSDAFMGDVPASNYTWGYHFKGQQLVYALVKDLIKNYGLSNLSTVIFAGNSAGARGVMALIDTLILNYLPKGTDVIGFMDSPFYIDVPPMSKTSMGFQYEEQQKYALYNPSAILSTECTSFHVGHEWKCLFGQYRIPFIKAPFFMIASHYDEYQLRLNMARGPPFFDTDVMAFEYMELFVHTTKTLISQLAEANNVFNSDAPVPQLPLPQRVSRAKPGGFAYYSWACYNHDVSDTQAFFTMHINGITQKRAFELYLDRKPLQAQHEGRHLTMSWIDDCREFACGAGCPTPEILRSSSNTTCGGTVSMSGSPSHSFSVSASYSLFPDGVPSSSSPTAAVLRDSLSDLFTDSTQLLSHTSSLKHSNT